MNLLLAFCLANVCTVTTVWGHFGLYSSWYIVIQSYLGAAEKRMNVKLIQHQCNLSDHSLLNERSNIHCSLTVLITYWYTMWLVRPTVTYTTA